MFPLRFPRLCAEQMQLNRFFREPGSTIQCFTLCDFVNSRCCCRRLTIRCVGIAFRSETLVCSYYSIIAVAPRCCSRHIAFPKVVVARDCAVHRQNWKLLLAYRCLCLRLLHTHIDIQFGFSFFIRTLRPSRFCDGKENICWNWNFTTFLLALRIEGRDWVNEGPWL